MNHIPDPPKLVKPYHDSQNALTELYNAWCSDMLDAPIVREADATCLSCAMLKEENSTNISHEHFFHPDTKCCTYYPSIPNFSIGMILGDNDANGITGKNILKEQLTQEINVTPLRLMQPQQYSQQYSTNTAETFGTDPLLQCPFYQSAGNGICSIWNYRNSVCSTWFCKHKHAKRGIIFWRILKQFLNNIEDQLAMYCALQLKIDEGACIHILPRIRDIYSQKPGLPAQKKENVSPKKLWGSWYDKKQEFFLQCAEIVLPLQWADIEKICGPELQIYAKAVHKAYADMEHHDLPQKLKPAPLIIDSLKSEFVGIRGYSQFDPVDIPQKIFGLLHYFEGKSVSDAVRIIAEQEQVTMSYDDIQLLIDHEILMEDFN